jgi:hypothetical protein
MIVGPDRLEASAADMSLLYILTFAGIAIPAFGGLLWLHATPGTPETNRFGAVPDATGFSPRAHRKAGRASAPATAAA